MFSAIGVSASDPSRVVLHLLDDASLSSNEHPFPCVQSHDAPREEPDDHVGDADLDQSHLVVQGPVHMQGTARQAINYINDRINPKEQEPGMYFRSLPAAPEGTQEQGDPDNVPTEAQPRLSLVELVISTKYRDDVQVQVDDSHQMELFLQVIPHVRAHTLYLRVRPNNNCLPDSIAGSLDKALSNHPTLKRLWLQSKSTSHDTEVEGNKKDDGMLYSIAASILKHPQSCIKDVMVEGYGATGTPNNDAFGERHEGVGSNTELNSNIGSLLQALEKNSSVNAISFVKTNETLPDNNGREGIIAMVLRLGQTLRVNGSIEKLYLGNLLEYLSYEEVESFATSVRQMRRLKVLDLRLVHRLVLPRPDLRFGNHMQISPRHRVQARDNRSAAVYCNPGKKEEEPCLLQPIVDALEENCSLIKIPGWKKYIHSTSTPQDSQPRREAQNEEMQALENALNYHLQLNRSRAKQFVHEPTLSIPAWSLVLERCRGNPTAMYYCLRHKVASVCA